MTTTLDFISTLHYPGLAWSLSTGLSLTIIKKIRFLNYKATRRREMRQKASVRCREFFIFFLVFIISFCNISARTNSSVLTSFLPEMKGWEQDESPQHYFPQNLFEYINGAAESYLSYNFEELIVAQFRHDGSEKNVSIEIYDMGNYKNSFGIYSAERFPDNQFAAFGLQGYMEEGALNFLIGKYYVKFLCFECGKDSDKTLKAFVDEIVRRVKDKGNFPPLLAAFPKEGLLPNTERYVLRNFMGYGFLHDGYLASYKVNDLEFQCFLIEGKDPQEAQVMLDRFLDKKDPKSIEKKPSNYVIKDRYYHSIYLSLSGNCICGVLNIKEGYDKIGEKYLLSLNENLERTKSS